MKIIYVNAADQMDNGEKWEKLFNEIFVRKKR
jgi:hypothetical protein